MSKDRPPRRKTATPSLPSTIRSRKQVRLLRMSLLLLLDPAHVTFERLRTELGSARRTLFRDLDILRQAGLPIRFDASSRRYYVDSSIEPPDQRGADLLALIQHLLPKRNQVEVRCTLSWQESVVLLASLAAVQPPESSEWREVLDRLSASIHRAIAQRFGERAGSIDAYAKLLQACSTLSLSKHFAEMERFWARESEGILPSATPITDQVLRMDGTDRAG